jgi:predicted transcriptional regulator
MATAFSYATKLYASPYIGATGMANQDSLPHHGPLQADGRAASPPSPRLGEREREVLELLWEHGSATVQDIAFRLASPLAYTTVMTTLDRLYKKRLLVRSRRDRAFVYTAAISRNDLERGRADAIVQGFFSRSSVHDDALLSCLVDAMCSYDNSLLLRLEEKVRIAKEQMMDAKGTS